MDCNITDIIIVSGIVGAFFILFTAIAICIIKSVFD